MPEKVPDHLNSFFKEFILLDKDVQKKVLETFVERLDIDNTKILKSFVEKKLTAKPITKINLTSSSSR
jgi:hypothetical protein